jgi:hypothetical protein
VEAIRFSQVEKLDKGDHVEIWTLPGFGWNGEQVEILKDS